MKLILTVISAALIFSHTAAGQEWNLALARPSSPISIVVPAKHIIEFASIRVSGNQNGLSATLDFGNGAIVTSTAGAFPQPNDRFVGPLTITISISGMAEAFYSVPYRITNSTAVSATPSNAVVIPTNATGNVQIILESSTDMVTWTAASPGTYSPAASNRFFRVRAVQQ